MREEIGGFGRKAMLGVAALVVSSSAHCDVGQLQFKGIALGSDRAAVLKAVSLTCKPAKNEAFDEQCVPKDASDRTFAGLSARTQYRFADKKLDQVTVHLSRTDWSEAKAAISSKVSSQPACGSTGGYMQCKWNVGPDLITSTDYGDGVRVEYSWGAGNLSRALRAEKANSARTGSKMRDL